MRDAALAERHRKDQIARNLEAAGFLLEAPHGLVAVETEMDCVGAHEAERVDRCRQPVVTALLDRYQVLGTDAQRVGDPLDVAAEILARLTQQRADRVLGARGCRFGFERRRRRAFQLRRIFFRKRRHGPSPE